MNATSRRAPKLAIGAATALAVIAFAGCETNEAPKQVQAANPTVTYKYHNDSELVQTNDLATQYCSQYGSVPRSLRFGHDEGADLVVYECVTAWHPTLAPNYSLERSYTYRTDQELLSGSQDARAYCMANGSTRVVSNIVRNDDGTRTVMFQCLSS